MAIINAQDEEEKRRQALAMGAAPAVGGAVAGGAAGQPAAAPQAPQRQAFVSLGDYLAANRSQGQAMAGQLASGAEAKAKAAQTGLANLQAAAPAAVKAGTVGFAAPPIASRTWRALDDPGQRAASAGALAYAKTAADGSYKGPANLGEMAGYGQVQQDTNQAAQQLAGLTNESARTAQLAQAYGQQGNYNPGMARFDSFLAGAAGGDQLQAVQNRYSGLADSLAAANANTAPFDAGKAASDASRQGAQGYLDATTAQAGAADDARRQGDADKVKQTALARQQEEARQNEYKKWLGQRQIDANRDNSVGGAQQAASLGNTYTYDWWRKQYGK